jgi:hypothetical protein
MSLPSDASTFRNEWLGVWRFHSHLIDNRHELGEHEISVLTGARGGGATAIVQHS